MASELALKKKQEEDRLAAEAAAKKKAEEDRIAAELALKKKQEEDRIAAEAAAKKKAEEDRIAAELALKKKQEEDRLAAEAVAKKKAEEERLAAELALKKKQEEDRIAAEAEATRKIEETKRLISIADKAFEGQKWQDAKKNYELALALSPNSSYVKTRIASLQNKLKSTTSSNSDLEPKKTPVSNKADTEFKHMKPKVEMDPREKEIRDILDLVEKSHLNYTAAVADELGSYYPEGISEEQYKSDLSGFSDANVTRRIVVRDGFASIFTRYHSSRGITYRKNGQTTTEKVWLAESQDPKLRKNN